MKRKIAVVTTSRADYGHLYWPLRDLANSPDVDLRIIAIGPHLSPEYGNTVREIEADGLHVDTAIECLLSSDSDIGMAKTIGVATLGLADCLGRIRPDLMLLTADRYEMLAPASVGVALRIPMAHIEGGEISEGAIDDAVRNALTKLCHVHFTSTETARNRVIAMGEDPERVYCAGAPSLDHLRRSILLSREEVEARLGIEIESPATLIAYHPTTIARDTVREADAFFEALRSVPGQLYFCYPNADAGSRELIARAEAFMLARGNGRVFVNLGAVVYWSLLRCVDLLLGNSSSGVMEAASLELPAVDAGMRQHGRERGRNVVSAAASVESIVSAVQHASSREFGESLRGMKNPYGDGLASGRITNVLRSVPLGEDLLIKRRTDFPESLRS